MAAWSASRPRRRPDRGDHRVQRVAAAVPHHHPPVRRADRHQGQPVQQPRAASGAASGSAARRPAACSSGAAGRASSAPTPGTTRPAPAGPPAAGGTGTAGRPSAGCAQRADHVAHPEERLVDDPVVVRGRTGPSPRCRSAGGRASGRPRASPGAGTPGRGRRRRRPTPRGPVELVAPRGPGRHDLDRQAEREVERPKGRVRFRGSLTRAASAGSRTAVPARRVKRCSVGKSQTMRIAMTGAGMRRATQVFSPASFAPLKSTP